MTRPPSPIARLRRRIRRRGRWYQEETTQADLGALLGVSGRTVARWEAGHQAPSDWVWDCLLTLASAPETAGRALDDLDAPQPIRLARALLAAREAAPLEAAADVAARLSPRRLRREQLRQSAGLSSRLDAARARHDRCLVSELQALRDGWGRS